MRMRFVHLITAEAEDLGKVVCSLELETFSQIDHLVEIVDFYLDKATEIHPEVLALCYGIKNEAEKLEEGGIT